MIEFSIAVVVIAAMVLAPSQLVGGITRNIGDPIPVINADAVKRKDPFARRIYRAPIFWAIHIAASVAASAVLMAVAIRIAGVLLADPDIF